jgi:hypothetical protein
MRRKRVWSGRHNKVVFASYRYSCPLCKDEHGGEPGDHVKGERVCAKHLRTEYYHLPKKFWPREAR